MKQSIFLQIKSNMSKTNDIKDNTGISMLHGKKSGSATLFTSLQN